MIATAQASIRQAAKAAKLRPAREASAPRNMPIAPGETYMPRYFAPSVTAITSAPPPIWKAALPSPHTTAVSMGEGSSPPRATIRQPMAEKYLPPPYLSASTPIGSCMAKAQKLYMSSAMALSEAARAAGSTNIAQHRSTAKCAAEYAATSLFSPFPSIAPPPVSLYKL